MPLPLDTAFSPTLIPYHLINRLTILLNGIIIYEELEILCVIIERLGQGIRFLASPVKLFCI